MQREFPRSAGILLPVSSLPSKYGIGSFGKCAFDFIDQLKRAGQSYWQVLPLCPTSYGDSPYSSPSAFAGNPFFIDNDILVEKKLVSKEFVDSLKWGLEEDLVDYGMVYDSKMKVLREAFSNSDFKNDKDYAKFLKSQKYWLDDYCMYQAFKVKFDFAAWYEFEDGLKKRDKSALEKYRNEFASEIDFQLFVQYEFYLQWNKLHEYAKENGISIIGDIPIYVSYDSSDVWAHTEIFKLDKELKPKSVAGVPPDAFSETGQLWGNPIYDWDKLESDDFSWWRERMKKNFELYDVVRIDHFIGMVKYYSVNAKDTDAINGKWNKGPGMKLISAIQEEAGDKLLIAEDLGVKMPEVEQVLKQSGLPGMKVMEFAFNGDRGNEHLPYKWERNMVAYGGTHDNDTLVGYFKSLEWWELSYIREYMGDSHASVESLIEMIFRTAYCSVANLVIFQMQDVLKLDSKARMNTPATMGINWRWRLKEGQFTGEDEKRLRYYADIYGRLLQ